MTAASLDGTARWVWHARSVPAGLARAALLPAALAYRAVTWLRHAAYDAGALPSHALPLPAIGVGNLAVGGAGKTPLCAYIARELGRRGIRSAVLLRGYGGDEAEEYRQSAPGTLVVAGRDRGASAARAAAGGAEALVLDDCLQRRDLVVDAMLALVAAESWGGDRWPLPAGPWREGPEALARADALVVTHKSAGEAAARAVLRELAPRTAWGGMVAELGLTGLLPVRHGLGEPHDLSWLAGREVLAVCGVATPAAFGAQLAQAGAKVTLLAFGDHHAYTAADVARVVARAGARAVVTTGKDAVKLAALWPAAGAPPCLVATLGVRITHGRDLMDDVLSRAALAARRFTQREAARVPLHDS
ncbi:MAG: hypothetical protein A2085_10235 [Gemmatimonadetes bacterium GWC2_71_10]|nr:MAG: hypothetical protein A2085_10235 [Gemmatimonadetes bacterium GWC2_71_10]